VFWQTHFQDVDAVDVDVVDAVNVDDDDGWGRWLFDQRKLMVSERA
jgi:hypothetical protein